MYFYVTLLLTVMMISAAITVIGGRSTRIRVYTTGLCAVFLYVLHVTDGGINGEDWGWVLIATIIPVFAAVLVQFAHSVKFPRVVQWLRGIAGGALGAVVSSMVISQVLGT